MRLIPSDLEKANDSKGNYDNFSGSGHSKFMAEWPQDLDLEIMPDGSVCEVIIIDQAGERNNEDIAI